jgi:hypothetical protein
MDIHLKPSGSIDGEAAFTKERARVDIATAEGAETVSRVNGVAYGHDVIV